MKSFRRERRHTQARPPCTGPWQGGSSRSPTRACSILCACSPAAQTPRRPAPSHCPSGCPAQRDHAEVAGGPQEGPSVGSPPQTCPTAAWTLIPCVGDWSCRSGSHAPGAEGDTASGGATPCDSRGWHGSDSPAGRRTRWPHACSGRSRAGAPGETGEV